MKQLKDKTAKIINAIVSEDTKILDLHSEFVKYCNTSKKTACPRCNPTDSITCYIEFMKKKMKPKNTRPDGSLPYSATFGFKPEYKDLIKEIKSYITPDQYKQIFKSIAPGKKFEKFLGYTYSIDWCKVKQGTEIILHNLKTKTKSIVKFHGYFLETNHITFDESSSVRIRIGLDELDNFTFKALNKPPKQRKK